MNIRTIGLLGNPNCGKSTLFNRLTGASQRVGNWPGVTVEQKSGSLRLGDQKIEVIDLPGIYSLDQTLGGVDESIAQNFMRSEQCDLIINVVDASHLDRHLTLTQQLLEYDVPVIVALNMLDVAESLGITVSAEDLEKTLGVPVVPMIASKAEGLKVLLDLLSHHSANGALKEGPQGAEVRPQGGPESDVTETLVAAEKRYLKAVEISGAVTQVRAIPHAPSELIDRVVLNRWLGVPIFLAAMYLMFTLAINLGAVFIDFFDILFGAIFVTAFEQLLSSVGVPIWLNVLLSQGLGGGIQLVATFIPVIGFLFLCLSVMEDSGYMSRAAFVIDRLMIGIGLPGSAFVPLIVGFGCNVPAVMATRTLSQEQDRLMTIAMAPFMSCGARLTVYALFAAAFFKGQGQNVVFLLYLLGIGMAILTGWLFRKQIFQGQMSTSYAEMPVYHVPVVKNLLLTTWFRLKSFILRAGRTIVLVVMGLSFLNAIGTDGSFGHENKSTSVLSVVGKGLTPLFKPMGITEDNWPATVGLFTGLFAKEAVVGTLDALYSGSADTETEGFREAVDAAFLSVADNALALSDTLLDPLGLDVSSGPEEGQADVALQNMAAYFGSNLAAFSYLVFILLYAPCVAVIAAMHKESGLKWAVLVFGWTTLMGYMAATTVYQLGSFNAQPVFATCWLLGVAGVATLAVKLLGSVGRRALPQGVIPAVQLS
ncbi:MAG: ferrous iron transport protein B [Gammaproteobacteria bacterium]|nr:ferrous iron transport protein B [Gammaproteobacteria bacterium]